MVATSFWVKFPNSLIYLKEVISLVLELWNNEEKI